jgi:hypothetical protein
MSDLTPVDPQIIESLLIGACPEREEEIRHSWQSFKPTFSLKPDDVGAAICAHEGRVSWMHKTFALDWVVATLGLKASTAYGPHIVIALAQKVPVAARNFAEDDGLTFIESQMDDAVYFARSIREAKQLEDVEWPAEIPQPGTNPDPTADPAGKAAFDLACLGAAATLFHELRHVELFNEGSAPETSIEEERACDEHARSMLLDRVEHYCAQAEEPIAQVLDKRLMGLATMALCVALQELVGMEAAVADSHPQVSERFRLLVLEARADEGARAWLFTACILIYLLRSRNRFPESISFGSPKALCEQLCGFL